MIKYISHGMQEIRVRLSVEAIFFAISISLLQFFKINLGNLGGLLIFQIALKVRQSARNYQYSEINSFI